MRFKRTLDLMLPAVFLLLTNSAWAHVVGVSPWCLANSPVHFECYLNDHEMCEKEAKKKTTPLEEWRCESYPIDFSKIPRAGEKLTPERK